MREPRILIPIDFSDLSYHAFPVGAEIAQIFDGKVTPLYCYVPEMYIHPATGFEDDFRTSVSESDLLESEKLMLEKLQNITSKYVAEELCEPAIIKMERPAEGIVNASKDFDMIVMSTHGRTGFTRIIMGSVAEKVVRYSDIPVVVVEDKRQFTPLERIMVTTDLTDQSKAAFSYAVDFVRATNAELDLVHVVSLDDISSLVEANEILDKRKHKLKSFVDEYFYDVKDRVTPRVISTDASVHEALVKLTRKQEYNLLIMSTIGKTGLDYLRMGSTAANVVRHVKMPVMTIKPSKITH